MGLPAFSLIFGIISHLLTGRLRAPQPNVSSPTLFTQTACPNRNARRRRLGYLPTSRGSRALGIQKPVFVSLGPGRCSTTASVQFTADCVSVLWGISSCFGGCTQGFFCSDRRHVFAN